MSLVTRYPGLVYQLLVFGLLAAVIVGGAVTTAAAMQEGFTPIAGAARAPAGH